MRESCSPVLTVALGLLLISGVAAAPPDADTFRIWAAGDSHVPSDIRHGRESLAKAIRQSQGEIDGAPGFDWDIMIDVGDLSASQFPPTDADGQILVEQDRALK